MPMLIALDDTLLHQTAEGMAHAGVSDHRFFDRTVFGMQSPSGDLALISSFGVYKNMNVMDGFAMIQKGARRQFNHRFSRRLSSDPMTLRLGPLSIEHLEPLKSARLSLAPGGHPASYDIEWTAVLPPYEEPRHFLRLNGRVARDHTRFNQFAKARGWIEVEGERTEFDDWFAWRDHSWGVRPGVGGFEPFTGREEATKGFMGLYCWWLTDEDGGFVQLQEEGDGHVLLTDGAITFRDPDRPPVRVTRIEHDIRFHPGTRVFDAAAVRLTLENGDSWLVEGQSIGRPWAYKGSGYDSGYNDEKGLGAWRGDWLEEYDIYDITDPEAVGLPDGRVIRPVHREQIAQVTVNGRPGHAHFPLINWGPLQRYGLGV
jgi:hypothetical protein